MKTPTSKLWKALARQHVSLIWTRHLFGLNFANGFHLETSILKRETNIIQAR